MGGHCSNNKSTYPYCNEEVQLTMLEKSAPPTPTITMERGSLEAATILSIVLPMSEITPSYTYR